MEHDLEELNKLLLTMAGEVERQLDLAIRALVERDNRLAEEVIAGDSLIDQREVEVDHRVIELIVRAAADGSRPSSRDDGNQDRPGPRARGRPRVASRGKPWDQPLAAAQGVHHDPAHGREGIFDGQGRIGAFVKGDSQLARTSSIETPKSTGSSNRSFASCSPT